MSHQEMTSHEPVDQPPKRTQSSLLRRQSVTDAEAGAAPADPAPKRTRSALQRLGIAPIFGAADPELDRPPRSPTGAIRSISGISRRIAPPAARAADGSATVDVEGAGDGKEWHSMSHEALMAELDLGSLEHGLTTAEAEARLLKHGKNLITPPPQKHWLIKVLLLLVGGFQLMLFGGGILCFIVYGISLATDIQSLALGIVLIVVVFVSAAFQYYQEGKADKVMESLRQLTAENVFVVRDGETKQIPAANLVPGDVVKVNSGEKVPADIRVITSSDLKVNNAPLTGENVDIKLGPHANHKLLYEAKNVARSGCNFTSGNGVAVVFLTGDRTFFGLIAKSTTAVEHPDTLMKQQIRRLILMLGTFAVLLGILFLILALVTGYTWIDAVIFLISIVVANVPEGLLPQLTVALSITAQRLQQRGVLVSNLEIIETLGAVTVICSDKTGTLTCNRMTATHVVYDGKIHLASEGAPKMPGDTFEVFDRQASTFRLLHENIALNSDATFLEDETKQPDVLKRLVKGDASETAMVKFVEPLRSIAEHRRSNKRVAAIPFNSSNKWMLSIVEQEGDSSKPLRVYVKGAPEKVMNMCNGVIVNGEIEMFDEEHRALMEGINVTLGKRGERVIAMAYSELDRENFPPGFVFEIDPPNFPMIGLNLLGFMALIDPPRETVFNAISLCHSAGIKVIMVTGDHPITARSIAKSLNMITQKTKEEFDEEGLPMPPNYRGAIVVHGTEMETFTQDDWDHVLEHEEIVFARTMPQQKQELVMQLSRKNHVVAMTGDGVNDAPALKAAHVGIAMYSGAAVAKEAAQLILVDDDFSAIVEGVKEGRLIFDNLKKCIAYVLSSNVPELVPFLAFIAGKIPLAIETIVILTIDVGSDLAPAVSLAFEDAEDAIMRRPPRARDAHLVSLRMFLLCYLTIGVIQTAAAFFAFLVTLNDYGFSNSVLQGAGPKFRESYGKLDSERQTYFRELCVKVGFVGDCDFAFADFRDKVLAEAQAAFFATIIWGQVANLLTRKTVMGTLFSIKTFLGNRPMFWSFLSEFFVLFMLVYVPGLNQAFLMRGISAKHLFCGLWVIPAIIIWEETRKFFCRLYPRSAFAHYSGF
jgi:sodium/potassium-transporting ATPase subunit alpha